MFISSTNQRGRVYILGWSYRILSLHPSSSVFELPVLGRIKQCYAADSYVAWQHGTQRGKKRGNFGMLQDGWSQGRDIAIGVLGPLLVTRDGLRKDLPRSRKTRGLLAYLALMPQACRREDLCDLLWDGTADPRSELRWSLAKIKAAVGPWIDV